MVPTHVGPRPVYDSDVVYIIFYNYLVHLLFMTIMPTNMTLILFIQEVVEAEIPTDPIVERLNLVEEENNYLKERIKRIEEEKMLLELHVADVVNDNKIKMDAMRLKIRKIRKYAICTEAWYHYAVGSIVTFVAIMIAFVVALKCFTQFQYMA